MIEWEAVCPKGCHVKGYGQPPDKLTCEHGSGWRLYIRGKYWSVDMGMGRDIDDQIREYQDSLAESDRRLHTRASVDALLDSIEGVK